MNIASTSAVQAATSATQGSVTSNAQVLVLKKALDSQAAGALGLINAIPQQPPLASSGSLGTKVNTYV